MMKNKPFLIDVLPHLGDEIKEYFIKMSRNDLAKQVDILQVEKICECGDPDCGSFYLTQYEESEEKLEGFVFSLGTIEVYDGKIGFIEIIPGNEGYQIRTKLKENGIFY